MLLNLQRNVSELLKSRQSTNILSQHCKMFVRVARRYSVNFALLKREMKYRTECGEVSIVFFFSVPVQLQ